MLTMNKSILCVGMLIISLCFSCANSIPVKAQSIAKGADIGWMSQMEKSGIVWQNEKGVKEDPLKVLKEYGIDSIRLRVFVNPPAQGYQYSPEGWFSGVMGYCDQDSVVKMARRAKKLKMKVMIDFHYSDSWADPHQQRKPAAWKDHTFDQLKTDVYDHTYAVMKALKKAGVIPEWVQIGNEIRGGFLLPDGSFSDYAKATALLNQGYDAIKAVSKTSQVIIHLPEGEHSSLYRDVFDGLEKNGIKYDIVGMSYYPFWARKDYTETIDDLTNNMNDMVSRYHKSVMVVEVGGRQNEPQKTYDLLKAVIEKVKTVQDHKGLGVFYWEPECCASAVIDGKFPLGYWLGACDEVSHNVLKYTKAMDAFKE